MVRTRKATIVFIITLILFALTTIFDLYKGIYAYSIDCAIFTVLIILMYRYYNNIRLNLGLFILIAFSFMLHCSGVFGFYNVSPIGIQWDHVTHFVLVMTSAMVAYNFLYQFMSRNRFNFNCVVLVVLTVLAALGVGAVIENVEFLGYNVLGLGPGGLRFGDGDLAGGATQEISDLLDINVGGWFNTMWDLTINFIGALAGTFIMLGSTYWRKKAS
jgi:hypothetical protein